MTEFVMECISYVAWFGSLPAAALVFVLVFRGRSHLHWPRRTLAATSLALATLLALLIVAVSVLLRDGLGPGMIASTGFTAISRTAEGLLGLVWTLPLVLTGYWLARTPRPRRWSIPVRPKNYRRIALHAVSVATDPIVLMDRKAVSDLSDQGPVTQRGIRACINFEVRDGAEDIRCSSSSFGSVLRTSHQRVTRSDSNFIVLRPRLMPH